MNRSKVGVILVIITLVINGCFIPTYSFSASKPSKPVIKSLKPVKYNSITVTWKKSKNATKYWLQYKKSQKKKYVTYAKVKAKKALKYKKTIKGLIPNQKYYIRVVAVNGKKKAYSKVKIVRTLAKSIPVDPTPVDPDHEHEYSDWEVIKEPTCTEEGIKRKVCVCGDFIEETIEKAGHIEGTPIVTETTYTATTPGTKTTIVKCTKCGIELSNETIETGKSVQEALNDYSWADLASIANEISAANSEQAAINIAKSYHLIAPDGKLTGDETKSVALGNGKTEDVQILGFYHDDKSDGTGKAGITFGFKDCIATSKIQSSSVGGWSSTTLYSWINDTVYTYLPSDLQNVIVSVDKKTNNTGITTSISAVTITSDKLWLPSCVEVCGNWNNYSEWKLIAPNSVDVKNISEEKAAEADAIINLEGKQYKLYSDNNVTDASRIISKTWVEKDELAGIDEGYWKCEYETDFQPIVRKKYNSGNIDWLMRTPVPVGPSYAHPYYFVGRSDEYSMYGHYGDIVPYWSSGTSYEAVCHIAPAFCL